MTRVLIVSMTVSLLFTGCADPGEEKSGARKAVEEVVTKEFKLYDKAKDSIQKAQEGSQERRDAEKQLR